MTTQTQTEPIPLLRGQEHIVEYLRTLDERRKEIDTLYAQYESSLLDKVSGFRAQLEGSGIPVPIIHVAGITSVVSVAQTNNFRTFTAVQIQTLRRCLSNRFPFLFRSSLKAKAQPGVTLVAACGALGVVWPTVQRFFVVGDRLEVVPDFAARVVRLRHTMQPQDLALLDQVIHDTREKDLILWPSVQRAPEGL